MKKPKLRGERPTSDRFSKKEKIQERGTRKEGHAALNPLLEEDKKGTESWRIAEQNC